MSTTNRWTKFWHELKRRKVFGVIATYAATAYIVIEVVNNLIGPFRLPEWIPTFVAFLLVAGLPVAIILSWVFDLTPHGIIKTESTDTSQSDESPVKQVKRRIKPSHILNIILFTVVIVLAFPHIFMRDTVGRLKSGGKRISIAVMPFQNMTNDSLKNIWQDGIQDNLISALANSQDLQVRNKESVRRLLQKESSSNYASVMPSIARVVSKQLDADVFISGSLSQSGPVTRINAQLTDSRTNDVFKSFQVDGMSGGMLNSVDSLSKMIMNFLIISKLVKELPVFMQYRPATSSPEAYRCYLQGENARSRKDYAAAKRLFLQALRIDTNYTHMYLMLAVVCANQGTYFEGRKWCDTAYNRIDRVSNGLRLMINREHAFFYEAPSEEIKYLKQYLELDDNFPGTYYEIGLKYSSLFEYEKAIPQFEKALDIYRKFDMKPWWIYNYTELAYAYHQTKQYKKEEKIYTRAEKEFPNESTLTWRQAILYLTTGDTSKAEMYLRKYKGIYTENRWSEAALARNLGWAYDQAGMPEKAEESFRKAIELEPGGGFWYYYLGWHLIDKDINIDEGLKMIDKALELMPSYDWYFLDYKGWGLYKKGSYNDALQVLEKSWAIQPYYNHEKYMHLQEVRKAAQKNENS